MIEKALERARMLPEMQKFRECARANDNNIVVNALRGGSAGLILAELARDLGRPVLLLTTTLERAEALTDSLQFFGLRPMLFPPMETLPFEINEPVLHIATAQAEVLSILAHAKPGDPPPFLVAPVDALMLRQLPAEELRRNMIQLRWGEACDADELASKLVSLGFRREAMVESPGEFSIRGSIVDLYPPDAAHPWRLDLFGDEIESIRAFDTTTQRSLPVEKEIEAVRVLPRAILAPALDHLVAEKPLTTFFDLLPPNTLFIQDGPVRVSQRLTYYDEIVARHWAEVQHHVKGEERNFFVSHGIQPGQWLLDSAEASKRLAAFQAIRWVELLAEGDEPGAAGVEPLSFGAQTFDLIAPNYKAFLDLIQDKRADGFAVAVVCDNQGQVQRLDELLREHEIPCVQYASPGEAFGAARSTDARLSSALDVALIIGDLHEGFILPAARLLFLTDREMFGRYKKRRVHRKSQQGKPFKDPTEIQRGDYVVHSEHGIGHFEGVRRQNIESRMTEFLEIIYEDGDKLLVPIEKFHLVQKYASAEGKTPPLDKLGKKLWQRRRTRSQEKIRRLAGELLELYARREAAQGHAFGPDSVWQQEFEAGFLYQETPDQLRAIEDVKRDMISPRPMDRLVCGDVGYGKTEIAIRAAFKALAEGRQVAVLAPTTLLVQQHANTFRERLADYPFKTGMLSRFNSAAEQRETLERVETGEIQLVVGTHRLLSKDVRFKDLGLLVVDEEQRFGVAQKERIKGMKSAVDVLTLTATPIPRTLHMALAKLRDLSIIQTPPAARLPIKTRTIHFEKDLIEEAILRELNRGGQVYFVHNRIETIDDIARSIRDIVPRARIAVAHGQMDEDALEQIMGDFISGRHDILVSTTIIENGLDIPNVNTIIINRADAMGLAQLYQLRGRVGRDVRQAYAYLVLPKGQAITDTAVKRLAALEEFTELGMGFSIAMRDMEIRGAGSILGGEQHGTITEIGFEMYCKLLEEAVLELRGEPPAEPLWPTEVRWPVDQWLPETFIPVESQRIRFYKELASARTLSQLNAVRAELRDRYGALPPESEALLNSFRVKLSLSPWKVDAVRQGASGSVRISLRQNNRELTEELEFLAGDTEWIDRVERRSDGNIVLHLAGEEARPEHVLEDLAGLLTELGAPKPARAAIG